MSVKEVSLYCLGGGPIQYFGLDPFDPVWSDPKLQGVLDTSIFIHYASVIQFWKALAIHIKKIQKDYRTQYLEAPIV